MNSKTITVWVDATEHDSKTDVVKSLNGSMLVAEKIQADSIDFLPRGQLVIYNAGDLYKAYNTHEWYNVTVEDNYVQLTKG